MFETELTSQKVLPYCVGARGHITYWYILVQAPVSAPIDYSTMNGIATASYLAGNCCHHHFPSLSYTAHTDHSLHFLAIMKLFLWTVKGQRIIIIIHINFPLAIYFTFSVCACIYFFWSPQGSETEISLATNNYGSGFIMYGTDCLVLNIATASTLPYSEWPPSFNHCSCNHTLLEASCNCKNWSIWSTLLHKLTVCIIQFSFWPTSAT